MMMQCNTIRSPVYATDSEFLNSSGDAGFVLALPLHHRDLEFDSIGGVPEDHVAGHNMVGGLCAR